MFCESTSHDILQMTSHIVHVLRIHQSLYSTDDQSPCTCFVNPPVMIFYRWSVILYMFCESTSHDILQMISHLVHVLWINQSWYSTYDQSSCKCFVNPPVMIFCRWSVTLYMFYESTSHDILQMISHLVHVLWIHQSWYSADDQSLCTCFVNPPVMIFYWWSVTLYMFCESTSHDIMQMISHLVHVLWIHQSWYSSDDQSPCTCFVNQPVMIFYRWSVTLYMFCESTSHDILQMISHLVHVLWIHQSWYSADDQSSCTCFVNPPVMIFYRWSVTLYMFCESTSHDILQMISHLVHDLWIHQSWYSTYDQSSCTCFVNPPVMIFCRWSVTLYMFCESTSHDILQMISHLVHVLWIHQSWYFADDQSPCTCFVNPPVMIFYRWSVILYMFCESTSHDILQMISHLVHVLWINQSWYSTDDQSHCTCFVNPPVMIFYRWSVTLYMFCEFTSHDSLQMISHLVHDLWIHQSLYSKDDQSSCTCFVNPPVMIFCRWSVILYMFCESISHDILQMINHLVHVLWIHQSCYSTNDQSSCTWFVNPPVMIFYRWSVILYMFCESTSHDILQMISHLLHVLWIHQSCYSTDDQSSCTLFVNSPVMIFHRWSVILYMFCESTSHDILQMISHVAHVLWINQSWYSADDQSRWTCFVNQPVMIFNRWSVTVYMFCESTSHGILQMISHVVHVLWINQSWYSADDQSRCTCFVNQPVMIFNRWSVTLYMFCESTSHDILHNDQSLCTCFVNQPVTIFCRWSVTLYMFCESTSHGILQMISHVVHVLWIHQSWYYTDDQSLCTCFVNPPVMIFCRWSVTLYMFCESTSHDILHMISHVVHVLWINQSWYSADDQSRCTCFVNPPVTCALQARFKLNKDPTSAIRKCNLSSLLQKIICVRNNMCPLI